jgi:D-glycero-alpha-D-manno-heptose-7-phosphate kinase
MRMIIAKSPLRITLGGGGTDLPAYYEKKGGFFISAAIDRFVYCALHQPFSPKIYLKYSKLEVVEHTKDIENPIIRECFKQFGIENCIELASFADAPYGTGLGSSGSFTTALIKAVCALKKTHITEEALAKSACAIEIDILKQPIGLQDQYVAAFGGLNVYEVDAAGAVTVSPLRLADEVYHELESNLLLYFTGYQRSTNDILSKHTTALKNSDDDFIKNMDYNKELGVKSKLVLEKGDLDAFGRLMHEHWLNKKSRQSGMSNSDIDAIYDAGLANGAIGGKVIGAGGGGFVMFYAQDRLKLRRKMKELGLRELHFNFHTKGTSLL